MQVTKLRLVGFKSFVEPTELWVEPGLTGIVGPNGCGKSNLIDAVRWVMGESSARGLRGGGMEDVIFAGTAARPSHDLAEVALHLRPGDMPVPGLGVIDELELVRRIARGAGSAYQVNGREMRARDVQLLFADATSGARSATIVSQGQIGALVEAKPVERRRLLEEAAGVAGLQSRRHEAELKLQAAEANLVRVEDRLVGLREQHDALQKQARQAGRYRKLGAAHREAEAALLLGRWQRSRAELATARETLDRSRAEVAAGTARLTTARAERDRAMRLVAERRQADAALATELARLGERLMAARGEAARLDDERERLEESQRLVGRDLDHARAMVADAAAAKARSHDERQALVAGTAQLEQELDEARRSAAAAHEAAAAAAAEARGALTAFTETEAAIDQLTARREAVAREGSQADQTRDHLRAELAGLDPETPGREPAADLAVTGMALAEAGAHHDGASAAVEAAEGRRDACRSALEEARQRWREADDRLRGARLHQGQIEQRCRDLEARRSEQAAREGRLRERLEEIDQAMAACAARRTAMDLDALGASSADAETRLAEAQATLRAAGSTLDEATRAEGEAKDAAQRQAATVARLAAEAQALAELGGPEGGIGDLASLLEVDPSHAEALASALGDDVSSSLDPAAPCHWLDGPGSEVRADAPMLPEDCRPLAGLVKAPPALARRLSQVGVVDAARAPGLQARLAQGQRLVSPDGGLWRWDGFVRRPDAARPASVRLQQATRRRQLERRLVTERAQLAAVEQDLAGLADLRVAAETALAGARQAEAVASGDLAPAREALLQAQARDAALATELEGLQRQRVAVEAERAEVERTARALAAEAQAGIPDGAAPPVESLEAELTSAEAALAERTAEDQQAEALLAEARRALSQARERLAAARSAHDDEQARQRQLESQTRERTLARAQREATLARLDQERAALEIREAELAASLAETEGRLPAARARLVVADEALAETRRREAEASAEQARLAHRRDGATSRIAALAEDLTLWSERLLAAEGRVAELIERERALASRLGQLDQRPQQLQQQHAALEEQIAGVEQRRGELGRELGLAETALEEAAAALDRAEADHLGARESGARLEARIERAESEAATAEATLRGRFGPEARLVEEEPPSAEEIERLEAELSRLDVARERLGAVNLRAIDEAEELALTIRELESEQAELGAAIERLRRAISTLNREGRERLRSAFAKVEEHFEALFARLFGGGKARIALTDMEDPLAAGVELYASPPGKKLQSVSLLSGGEKALTALALIVAVFLTRPAPLCVLDEVDAPLDDANVGRLAELLQELAEGTPTRFLVITHHPLTMARMDRLYGVTMAERGISQLVSVDLGAAVELRATA